MVCVRCRADIPDLSNYCNICGRPVLVEDNPAPNQGNVSDLPVSTLIGIVALGIAIYVTIVVLFASGPLIH